MKIEPSTEESMAARDIIDAMHRAMKKAGIFFEQGDSMEVSAEIIATHTRCEGKDAFHLNLDVIALRRILRECEKALDSLSSDALGQHEEIGHYYRDELLASVRRVLKETGE